MRRAKDKLLAFAEFRKAGVPHPEWWTRNEKNRVDRTAVIIARTTTTGSGGDGIVVVRPEDQLVDAPLYTRYVQKTAEYRLHVVDGAVIAVQQKRRDKDTEQTADQKLIRNHDNGWVFAVHDVEFTSNEQRRRCEDAAVSSIAALGLCFGAVDLVVDKKTGQPSVLEVNTAPGIESPTILAAYTAAFKRIQGATRYVYNQPVRASRTMVGARTPQEPGSRRAKGVRAGQRPANGNRAGAASLADRARGRL